MAYIGRQLARGENKLFDDISGSFNGSTTVFNLTVSSVATATATPYQLFVSLGGVMQKPNTDFTTAGNQITFTTAPAAGLSCWIMMQGDTIDQAAIPDASVTPSKISGSNFAFSGELRLKDADGSHYVGFASPTTVASNKVWTLPAADGSASQYLQTNGSGVLTWSSVTIGGATGIDFNDNVKARWGTGNDLEIFHDGSNSYLTNSTNALYLRTGTGLNVQNAGGTETYLYTEENGAVFLRYDNVNKFETTSAGATVTGALTVSTNATISGNLTVSGTTTTVDSVTLSVKDKNIEMGVVSSPSDTTADGGGITLKGATDKTFNWVNATDAWTSSEHIHLLDNKKLFVGTGSDLSLYHDGSNNYINSTITNGDLIIDSAQNFYIKHSGEKWIDAINDAGVKLYYDNVQRIETTSSGINVTGAINVNGSALSTAPTITATATGAIANQGAVCVRSDGNIEAVSGNAAATGSAQVIDSGATSPSRIKNPFRALYNPDKDKMYVLYSSSPDDGTGDNELKIVAVTLNSSDNTMSMGTPYTIRDDIHGTMSDKVADMAYDTNADKLVVVYRHNTNFLAARTLTPDSAGTSFTMGAPNIFTGTASEDPEHVSIAFDSAQNKFLCVYVHGNNELKYNVMYISGTSIASSNGQTKDAGTNYEPYVVYDPDQAKFIVSVTSSDGRSIGASIDAGATTTSVTWDTNYAVYKSGNSTRENRLVYDTTNNKVVVLYQQTGNLLAKVGTNSATGVSWGSETSYSGASGADEINAVHDTKMDNIFVICTASNNTVLLLKGDISGSSISFSTVGTLQSANSFTTAIGYDPDTGKVLGVYRDSATNDNLEGRVHQPAGTNVTAGNFIGFASAAISNGASGTVKVVGNTATKSSLTPGQKYFVQNDGSLDTTAASPSVVAGHALTSTTLLINP